GQAAESSAIKRVESSAVRDEAFSGLGAGTWFPTEEVSQSAIGLSDAVLTIGASNTNTQADLLLLIDDQGSLDRFDDTLNLPARDAPDEMSNTDYATALIDVWPTLD